MWHYDDYGGFGFVLKGACQKFVLTLYFMRIDLDVLESKGLCR